MTHHVARQLGQADLLGRDGQRFLDVDRGYDDGTWAVVVGPYNRLAGWSTLASKLVSGLIQGSSARQRALSGTCEKPLKIDTARLNLLRTIRTGCAENLSAEGLIDRLIGAVQAFAGDDMTCVVLRVENGPLRPRG